MASVVLTVPVVLSARSEATVTEGWLDDLRALPQKAGSAIDSWNKTGQAHEVTADAYTILAMALVALVIVLIMRFAR